MNDAPDLKLGLIGDNIARSRSPFLHRMAGAQNGLAVQYDRLIPKDMGEDFDTVFEACVGRGYRGINVTFPYKERAAKKVVILDPLVRAIGAVNTVLFEADGPIGQNTDYTGFIAGYRGVRGETAPGIACLIGTGGRSPLGSWRLGPAKSDLSTRMPPKPKHWPRTSGPPRMRPESACSLRWNRPPRGQPDS